MHAERAGTFLAAAALCIVLQADLTNGPRMHMTRMMWLQRHHKTHDQLISQVGTNVPFMSMSVLLLLLSFAFSARTCRPRPAARFV